MPIKKRSNLITALLVFVVLTACQSHSIKHQITDVSHINFTAADYVGKDVVESYIHIQPEFDVSAPDNDTNGHYVKQGKETNIWDRVRAGFRIKMHYHPRVLAEIRWFKNNPDYLERVYDRAEPVLHYVLEQVEKRGLPTELALLPVVESAFQPFAFSHASASGIWQFIPSTGKIYGLKQNWWYDGRRDLVASTRASLAYLRKLHKQFDNDWLRALASYNTGEARVAREVRRNRKRGRKTDFWNLRLPKETRAYVPKLLAIRAIIQNAEKYGLSLREIPDEPQFKSVFIGSQIDLAIAAELAGISLEEMYKLNPGFNRWATSPYGPHRLLIPIEVADDFKTKVDKLAPEDRLYWKDHRVTKNRQSISSLARQYKITPALIKQSNDLKGKYVKKGHLLKIPVSYLDRRKYTLSLTQRIKGSELLSQKRPRGRRKLVYRVRRGDSLYRVARRFRVSRTRLAKWNGLSRRSKLRRGQRLVIYKSKSRRRYIRQFRKRSRSRSHTRSITYVVRRGDTLASIARRHRTSVKNLRRWNRKLSRRGYIHPGQRLRIHLKKRSRRKR